MSFDASLHLFLHTHFFSCKETVCSICSVGNCFYLLQKNSSIIHCAVFKEPFLSLLLTRSSLKIKQLKLSRSLSQTFDVFAAIAAP